MQSDSAKHLSESIPKAILGVTGRPGANRHARRAYPRLEKTFSREPVTKLTDDQRRVIMAKAWQIADMTRPGKHSEGLTILHVRILHHLVWRFHNKKHGWCFPSYEQIAAAANCARSTVAEAIKALRKTGLLTWVQGITRTRVTEFSELLGQAVRRIRVFRASNRYRPIPSEKLTKASKSENRTGTKDQVPNHKQSFDKPEETAGLAQALATFGERVVRANARAGPE